MTNRSFIDELIKAINDYRSIHQVEPLRHNAVISTVSQSWADRLARSGVMEHNPNRKHNGEPLGENIAMKWSSDRRDYTGKEAAEQWYSEIKDYNFTRHAGPNTGHFTQLVWKSSQEIGVGRAQSRDGKWFVVTNYFPAGNFVGRYAENVLPARSKADRKLPSSGVATPVGQQHQRQQPIITDSAKRSPFLVSRETSPFHSSATPPVDRQTRFTSSTSTSDQTTDGSKVIERRQETRTRNGITTTTITETRRDGDGRTRTVTSETTEPFRTPGNANGNATAGFQEMSLRFNAMGFKEPEVTSWRQQQSQPTGVTVVTKQLGIKPSSSSPLQVLQLYYETFAYYFHQELYSRPSFGSMTDNPRQAVVVDTIALDNLMFSDREFANQVVRQHNVYRRKHGNVGDLTLNSELSQTAERWARHLASVRKLEHSDSKHRSGESLGENIAYKYSSLKEGYTGDEVVDQWYNEIRQYNWRNPDSSVSTCGHFTQVVWKGSREIGVGRAFADGGERVYVVCTYHPHGNVIGLFKDNVLAAK